MAGEDRLVPDDRVPGAFHVKFGATSQSWVDPEQPDLLVYEYVQHIALVLDATALRTPQDQRLRVIHIGGAGMSLPRWVAWRRPQTAQIVLEPDGALVAEVRNKIPLPPRSGIKVREVDGRSGVAAMPADYADVVILDAFDGAQVPGDLVTAEALDELRRIGRGENLVILNVTDRAPFHWGKRVAAGLQGLWPHVAMGAEAAVHKGKRFGNLVMVGAAARLDLQRIRRASSALPFGYRWLDSKELTAWVGGAEPLSDDASAPSPPPSGSKLWFH